MRGSRGGGPDPLPPPQIKKILNSHNIVKLLQICLGHTPRHYLGKHNYPSDPPPPLEKYSGSAHDSYVLFYRNNFTNIYDIEIQ